VPLKPRSQAFYKSEFYYIKTKQNITINSEAGKWLTRLSYYKKYNKNERKESTSATCTRVHFRPLKKGVVLHLAIVKNG